MFSLVKTLVFRKDFFLSDDDLDIQTFFHDLFLGKYLIFKRILIMISSIKVLIFKLFLVKVMVIKPISFISLMFSLLKILIKRVNFRGTLYQNLFP